MISKTIKYTDFNGKEVKKTFWFHLGKADLARVVVTPQGLTLPEVIATRSDDDLSGAADAFDLLREIAKHAIGVRSADGSRFIRSDEARSDLFDTGAYDEFFTELMQDEKKAAEFMNGVMPKDAQQNLREAMGGKDVSDLSKEELLEMVQKNNNLTSASKEPKVTEE